MSFQAFITFLWDKKHQKNNPMQAIDQSMNVSMNQCCKQCSLMKPKYVSKCILDASKNFSNLTGRTFRLNPTWME